MNKTKSKTYWINNYCTSDFRFSAVMNLKITIMMWLGGFRADGRTSLSEIRLVYQLIAYRKRYYYIAINTCDQ